MNIENIIKKVELYRLDAKDFSLIDYAELIETLEKRIFNNIILKHHTGDAFSYPVEAEKYVEGHSEVMLPDEFEDVYVNYILTEIDLLKNETARYANSMTLFNAAYLRFARYINRTYEPKQLNHIIIGGM